MVLAEDIWLYLPPLLGFNFSVIIALLQFSKASKIRFDVVAL
jgi:hypothetical protein